MAAKDNWFTNWYNSTFTGGERDRYKGRRQLQYQGFKPVSEDDPWADIMNLGGGQPTYGFEFKPRGTNTYQPFSDNYDDENMVEGSPPPPEGPTKEQQFSQVLNQAMNLMNSPVQSQTTGGVASEGPPPMRTMLTNQPSGPSTAQQIARSAARPPLEGTLEPRRPAISQARPALERPPLEGEVVRRSLTGPSPAESYSPRSLPQSSGGAGAIRTLPQDPAWATRALQAITSRNPRALLATALFGKSTSTLADEIGGTPMQGFAGVPAEPDFTLGGMFRPQSFDSTNDILLDMYLRGEDPYAKVLYSRDINGYR